MMRHNSLQPCDNEKDFFHHIAPIIMKQYEKEKNITPLLYKDHNYEKRPPIIVFINISTQYNKLFNYPEFTKWFIKPNFKYTFYQHVKPHNPTTLYVDNIFINQYYISNDITESTKIIKTSSQIINTIVFFILSFFYDKTKKVYMTAQFIMREPGTITNPLT
jgi:hypothetical protein